MPFYGNIVIKTQILPTEINVASVKVGQDARLLFILHTYKIHEVPDRN